MSRSNTHSPPVFDLEAIAFDTLPADTQGAVQEVKSKPVEAPKRGRPTRTTAKPKATPLYLHPAVKEVLRDICYHHRAKEHDLFLEGINLMLKKRNYPSIAEIIAKAESEKS